MNLTNRIGDAAKLIANAALAHPDVDAATAAPPDDNVFNHFFIADFAVDDFTPLWGDFVDVNFSLRYATEYRASDDSWDRAYRIMDRDSGLPALLEALSNASTDSPIEFLKITRGGASVVLDQSSNTRYLAVDMTADVLIRSTG